MNNFKWKNEDNAAFIFLDNSNVTARLVDVEETRKLLLEGEYRFINLGDVFINLNHIKQVLFKEGQ